MSIPHASYAADLRGRVVDDSGAGVADAVVFVEEPPPGTVIAPQQRAAVMDQIQKEFVPHILAVPVGTEVLFPNHDQIHHHVYSFSRPKSFEIPLYKGESAPPVVFDKPGAVKVGCNIHDWMSSVILVVPTPYFAITDETGAFVIHDMPPGSTLLTAWHERSKAKSEDVQRRLEIDSTSPEVTFTLPLAPPRPRPGMHGMRRYE